MPTPAPTPTVPLRRRLPWALGLALLGLGGNVVSLPLGFNVNFIFGSVFGLLAVGLLGPALGGGAAAVASAYTLVLWNHPYAIAIFTGEALWVALALRRRPSASLFLLDLAYWAAVGVPLVCFFYFAVMDLGARATATVALKQTVNGVCNAIIAGALLNHTPLRRLAGLPEDRPRSQGQLFFEIMALLLMVSSVGGLIYMNDRDVARARATIAARVEDVAQHAQWGLTRWVEDQVRITDLLAAEAQTLGIASSAPLQAAVARFHAGSPDFHNMLVADAGATTVAFDPPVNERGESTLGLNYADREWYRQLRLTKRSHVSDVFMGRGGVFEPIFAVTSPILRDGQLVGVSLGAVNLERMRDLVRLLTSKSGAVVTLIDRSRRVVVSSDASRPPLSALPLKADGAEEVAPGVRLHLPESRRNVSYMQAWKDAVYFAERPVAGTNWTVVVEGPLSPIQQQVYEASILNLIVIFLLLFATNALSLWLSRLLARPAHELAALTVSLPERIESGAQVAWPAPDTAENAALTESFRQMAGALAEKLTALKLAKETLERRVAERTAELQASHDKLSAVAEAQRVLLREVNHRVKNNLGVVLGMLRLEEGRDGGAAGRGLLEELEGRVQALATVHSLLSSTEWRPVRVRELCEQVVAGGAGGGGTRLKVSGTDATVEASQAHHLALVLNELATNSGKYARTARGAPQVSIEVALEAEGERVRVDFRDDGPGYPARVLADVGAASGTGLRLVKGIVERSLAGEVVFANDGGARATIRFPRSGADGGENGG